MIEILSQAQQTIASVPFDPEKMTTLIQKISDIYLAWLGVFVGICAIILALASFFQYKLNHRIEDDVKEAKNEINIYKTKLIEMEEKMNNDTEKIHNLLKEALDVNSMSLRLMHGLANLTLGSQLNDHGNSKEKTFLGLTSLNDILDIAESLGDEFKKKTKDHIMQSLSIHPQSTSLSKDTWDERNIELLKVICIKIRKIYSNSQDLIIHINKIENLVSKHIS